jgi:DNA invertase Pin-like site-specific DNA recombinase
MGWEESMKKEAIIYARISTNTEKQNIKQQIEHCKEYAERRGYDVLKVFKEAKSGKKGKDERRVYARVLRFLEENPEVTLIVQDTDRITRNYYDGVEFEKFIIKNKINIDSVFGGIVNLSNASMRSMYRVKNIFNCYRVEADYERIMIGVEKAKKEGKFKGRKKGSKNKKRKLR